MPIQTVFKAGNSNVVAIPKDIIESLDLEKGSKVTIELGADGKSAILSKPGVDYVNSSVTPELLQVMERVNNRYGTALRKLAEL